MAEIPVLPPLRLSGLKDGGPLGILPDDWRLVGVGDIGRIVTGKTPPTQEECYWEGSIPFITPAELCGGPVRTAARTITTEGLSISKALSQGTVLVSCIGNIGKVGVLEAAVAVTNQQINAIIPKTEVADSWYLAYAVTHHRSRLQELAGKTTVPIVSKANFEGFLLPLPPIAEQRAIAHVLSTVQRAREATEAVIAAARELKRSLMHHLFTYGPVPPAEAERVALQETEIGAVPEHWVVTGLGKLAKIERGRFAHRPRNDPAFYGGDVPFIQTGDVTASGGHIRRHTQTLNGMGLSVSRVFPKGIVVITIAANIGYTAILEFDSAFPDSLIGITPHGDVLNEYLNYYLMTQQPEMDRLAPRGTQKNISIEFLAPWPTLVPPRTEQREIAGILAAVDRKIEAEEKRRAALDELFRSLLHQLMTGQVRLDPITILKEVE